MTEIKKIVRLARKDLPGEKDVETALKHIKGISFATARAFRLKAKIPQGKKLGEITEEEINLLEEMLETPHKFNFPSWILNRRKDFNSGIDMHLVESNLMFAVREDIQRMKKIKCYRGIRHMFGLKVRGQKTKSTGRKGVTIGVKRKKK